MAEDRSRCFVVIDGPAGAGKSTVSRKVAEKLGFFYLDTGAMYRAVSLFLMEKGIEPDDVERIQHLLTEIDLEFKGKRLYLNKEDVTLKIRTPEVDKVVSLYSAIPCVRSFLVDMQRRIANEKRFVVAEGRDMATVVFPSAEVKIFLTASAEVRAKRRCEDMKKMGFSVSYDEVLKDVLKRDKIDSTRKCSPLVKAQDAVEINTDNLSIEEVVEKIIEIVRKRCGSRILQV